MLFALWAVVAAVLLLFSFSPFHWNALQNPILLYRVLSLEIISEIAKFNCVFSLLHRSGEEHRAFILFFHYLLISLGIHYNSKLVWKICEFLIFPGEMKTLEVTETVFTGIEYFYYTKSDNMEMRWSIKKSIRVTLISAQGLVAVMPSLSSTMLKQGGKTKGIPQKF